MKNVLIAACCGFVPLLSNASCGAAFCTANSNWTTESATTEPGSLLDLRYEYVDQDQPRAGTHRVGVGEIPRHHDEQSTINHNLLLNFSHTFNDRWGMALSAPLVRREHAHVHNHHGEQIHEHWNFKALGDLRLSARYQLPVFGPSLRPSSRGLTFGLKLPTGRTDVSNDKGDAAERTLQPGTGSTDLLLGAYLHQKRLQSGSSWFVQAQYQHALNSHDNYRPGRQLGLDLGWRSRLGHGFGALVQLNLLQKWADSGDEAEPADSGQQAVFIAPGLSYALTPSLQLYGFYQKAVYQRVTGVQLTADHCFVAGISQRF